MGLAARNLDQVSPHESRRSELHIVGESTDRQDNQNAVREDRTSVWYLGIPLPKAENSGGPFVPDRRNYADYINDEYSLELQRKIATAFYMDEPILIEGGQA